MKIGLISDVHSNVEALTAVIQDMTRRQVDEVVCLGDCVGYGPEPEECLAILFDLCSTIVAGNHDHAVCGKMSVEQFSAVARSSVEFTRERLSPASLQRLRELPLEVSRGDLLFVHAEPVNPGAFRYVRDLPAAAEVFCERLFRYSFYGHTHLPVSFWQKDSGEVAVSLNPVTDLSAAGSFFCNVGSVGQPRDHDPRACYAILDSEAQTLTRHRVPYAWQATGEKIEAAGLPQLLGRRLTVGV